MNNQMLIISTLMLAISNGTWGASDVSSSIIPDDQLFTTENTNPSIFDLVYNIESALNSKTLTREAAINKLFYLGMNLPKCNTDDIAAIIDTLGDLGALDEGLELVKIHNL